MGDHHDERGGDRERAGRRRRGRQQRAEPQRAAEHVPGGDAARVYPGLPRTARPRRASVQARPTAGKRRAARRTASTSTMPPAPISAAVARPGRCRPGTRPALSAHTVSSAPSTVSARSRRRGADQPRARRRHVPPISRTRSASPPRADRRPRLLARDPGREHVAAARVGLVRVRGGDGRVRAAPTGKLRAEVQHHARDQP